MTDIREKCRLCPIDFGQRFGTLALLFVSARAGYAGGNLRRHQFKETAIKMIQLLPGADAGDHEAGEFARFIGVQRNQHGDLADRPTARTGGRRSGIGIRPALGSLCLLLAYCAIYALNGIADLAEDRRNGSRRPIASGAIAPRTAAWLIACLAAVAVAGAAALDRRFLTAVVLLLALGWVYSMPPQAAKRDYRTSSIVIFGLGALTYLAGWCVSGRSDISGRLVVVGLAMSLWMVFGGMTKDLSDVTGDRAAGRRSWPVAFGETGSRTGILVAGVVLAVGYASISIAAFHNIQLAGPVVAAGAVCAGICAATPLSRGGKSKARRPYRIFMITQYAAHTLLLCSAVVLAD